MIYGLSMLIRLFFVNSVGQIYIAPVLKYSGLTILNNGKFAEKNKMYKDNTKQYTSSFLSP